MELDLTGLIASAFIDAQARFAKAEDKIDRVRLWFEGDPPDVYTELTVHEFRALPEAKRETIRTAGPAAGLLDTSTSSNA